MTLKLLSYNILKGGGGREAELAGIISACAPDIAVLEEAYQPHVVRHLSEACAMEHWAAAPGHSVAFISRVPIAGHVWRRVRWARRAYLEIALPDGRATIFGVHLSAIHSNLTERRRAHELRGLLASVERHQHGLHLVTGDFNTLSPGERLDMSRLPPHLRAFAWITGGTIRWTTVKLMLDAGYADAFRIAHPSGEGCTFPTWDPQVRLDYAFVPDAFKAQVRRCEVVRDIPAARTASDHFPLFTEIAV